jgi:hypothetical protein
MISFGTIKDFLDKRLRNKDKRFPWNFVVFLEKNRNVF